MGNVENSDERELIQVSENANKDMWAREAFVACFVDILREVNRRQPGDGGATQLGGFLELLDRGAKVNIWELTQAALDKIKPPSDLYDHNEEKKRRKCALMDVALGGLAFLVENAATDQNARTRRMQREDKLRTAIRAFVEADEFQVSDKRKT